MGFLNGLFGKKAITIAAPVDGNCIPLTEVKDPTFSGELLGKGVAVQPVGNEVVAPADGTIEMIFPTGHAFTMKTEDGAELLVHVGIDTVQLKGQYFKKMVSDGDQVKKGDLVIVMELEEIQKAGYDTVIPIVVCNTDDYKEVQVMETGTVTRKQDILQLEK